MGNRYGKVLVTGGTGVLGMGFQAIRDELGDREFTFIDSSACDLTVLKDVKELVGDLAPEALIHLAAMSGGVRLSIDRPATLLRDNVIMNMNVLEAARAGDVGKTVMTLSSGMYSEDAPMPFRESSVHEGLPHPSNSSYAFAKRLVEPSVKAYRAEYGMSVIGLVPNGIFGEHGDFTQESSAMWAALIRRFYENRDNGEKLVIWGDGSGMREHTYAQDMARAFMWCLDNYDEEAILNVGTTEEHSVKDIAYMIVEIMDIDPQRLEFDATQGAGVARKSTDNSRFLQLSDFEYTPFRVGLEKTIHWFGDNYDLEGKINL
jgi:GDP-L-fucose synthase